MSAGCSQQDEARPPQGTEEDGPMQAQYWDPARHWRGVLGGWELLRRDINLPALAKFLALL